MISRIVLSYERKGSALASLNDNRDSTHSPRIRFRQPFHILCANLLSRPAPPQHLAQHNQHIASRLVKDRLGIMLAVRREVGSRKPEEGFSDSLISSEYPNEEGEGGVKSLRQGGVGKVAVEQEDGSTHSISLPRFGLAEVLVYVLNEPRRLESSQEILLHQLPQHLDRAVQGTASAPVTALNRSIAHLALLTPKD
jgi:hypothetical protein